MADLIFYGWNVIIRLQEGISQQMLKPK